MEDGWFSERSLFHPGQSFRLEVEEVLYHERSNFQNILVFKSKSYGNVLVLDGMIQYTERDECSYQEMLSHVALNSHPNPKQVLVVGGGDMGVIREVLKHPLVEQVTQCEIDEKVIEISKKHFTKNSSTLENPRLKLCIADAAEFMKNQDKAFDVIITDCSDTGPAEPLFQLPYFVTVKKALKPGGIMCFQEDGMWNNLEDTKKDIDKCRMLFPVVDYAWSSIPSLPGGHMGIVISGLSAKTNFREPVRKWGPKETKLYDLKYYSADVHRAAFVVPEFARRVLHAVTEITNGVHSD